MSSVGTVEDALALLVETNVRLGDHERRIKTPELATMERIVMHTETPRAGRRRDEGEGQLTRHAKAIAGELAAGK